MSAQKAIDTDLKEAMLSRDVSKVEILRGLKSAILYEEVALHKRDIGLNEDEIIVVLKREAKKRRDAIDLYEASGNRLRANKEKDELIVIEKYLPKILDDHATSLLIDEVMTDLSITNPTKSDMGDIIRAIKDKSGVHLDMRLVAKLVQKKIG